MLAMSSGQYSSSPPFVLFINFPLYVISVLSTECCLRLGNYSREIMTFRERRIPWCLLDSVYGMVFASRIFWIKGMPFWMWLASLVFNEYVRISDMQGIVLEWAVFCVA